MRVEWDDESVLRSLLIETVCLSNEVHRLRLSGF